MIAARHLLLGRNSVLRNPASVLQQEVRDKFVNITSIEVSSHKFKSLVTNYVNKLKKNKGRKSENEILGDLVESPATTSLSCLRREWI